MKKTRKQTGEGVADGITHWKARKGGGFKLSRQRNLQIQPAWRNSDQWYPDGVEAAKVVETFWTHFSPESVREAGSLIKECGLDGALYPPEATPIQREAIDAERAEFKRQTRGRFVELGVSRRAVNPWVPEGYVGVFAGINPETRGFLVPESDYDRRGPFGMVIDQRRHKSWDSDTVKPDGAAG